MFSRLPAQEKGPGVVGFSDRPKGRNGGYCGAYALWAEATAQIQKYGAMIKSPTGFPIQSPYLAIANHQAEIVMRIASELGFTPASVSRLATPASGVHHYSIRWRTRPKSLSDSPEPA